MLEHVFAWRYHSERKWSWGLAFKGNMNRWSLHFKALPFRSFLGCRHGVHADWNYHSSGAQVLQGAFHVAGADLSAGASVNVYRDVTRKALGSTLKENPNRDKSGCSVFFSIESMMKNHGDSKRLVVWYSFHIFFFFSGGSAFALMSWQPFFFKSCNSGVWLGTWAAS